MMSTEEISLFVRIMPNADDVEVSLPTHTAIRSLKEHLLSADLGIPKLDDAQNPIVYQLLAKGKNEVLDEKLSMRAAGIRDGDMLLMIPKVIAG